MNVLRIFIAALFLCHKAFSTGEFEFGRLTREHLPADDTYRFVVEYAATATELPEAEVFAMGYSPNVHHLNIPVIQTVPGKIEFSIPSAEYEEAAHFSLRITVGDTKYTLPLEHISGVPKNMTEEIPNARMEVLPGNDVTYNDGDDTVITSHVRVHVDLKNRNLLESLTFSCDVEITQLAFSVDAGSFVLTNISGHSAYSEPGDEIQIFADSPTPRRLQTQILVKTSERKLDGVMTISYVIKLNDDKDRILGYGIEVSKSIRLYKSDHEGPFPRGSIGFRVPYVVMRDYEVIAHKADSHTCDSRESTCEVYCAAAGSNPKSLEIVRVSSNGDEVTVYSTAEAASSKEPYIRANYVIENPGPNDAGQYACIARTPKMEILRTIHVSYGQLNMD